MDIKKQINDLFSKSMSRQDFLKHAAMGAVALVGGGALLRMGLSDNRSGGTSQKVGYGDSAYGGIKQGGEQPARRAA